MPDIIQVLKATKLEFVRKERASRDVYSFSFRPHGSFRHRAGQHGLFFLPGLAGVHAFTLANAPEEELVIIGTHVREGSRYKARLMNLASGEALTMRGPMLDFTLDTSRPTAVLLAQGIGVTPFRSMLLDNETKRRSVTTHLIHVDAGDHPYRRYTEPAADHASYPATGAEFTAALAQSARTLAGAATYFVSGSPAFVASTAETLTALGVSRRDIKKDGFLGY